MKTRLLIGVLACAAALAVLTLPVGTAYADPPGAQFQTCGTSDSSGDSDAMPNPAFAHYVNPGPVHHWTFQIHYKCGQGKIFGWEIQVTTDQGSHWNDITVAGGTDHYWTVDRSCSNTCTSTWDVTGDGCVNTGHWYRVKTWNYNDRSYVSNYLKAGEC